MELRDLCGEHLLYGVDFTTVTEKDWGGYDESLNACRFRLDGKTYAAVEDRCDGYRSHMRDLTVSDDPTTNEWSPVRVVASMAADGKWEHNDILEIRDVKTGGIVLRVGTANTRDYYPYYVAEFSPENLAHNAPALP